jgi:pimeloyl-ACP methyl ester carboxylesterase
MRFMNSSKIEPPKDKLPPAIQKIRLWAVAQPNVWFAAHNPFEAEELAALYAERRKTEYPLGDLPLIVLHRERGGYEPIPGMITPELAKQLKEERAEQTWDLARLSRNSAHIYAKNSGHDIHLDRPELVIDAIRQVVEAVRHQTSVKSSEIVK